MSHPPPGDGPALVFAGHGAQRPRMGVDLLDADPAFREAVEACHQAISRHAGWSLVDVLRAEPGRSRLDDPEVGLPAGAALGIALASWWRARGVVPGAVIGHSFGEIAAAHVAGAITAEEAMRVAVEVATRIARPEGRGGMLLVGLPWDQAGDLAAPVLAGGSISRAIQASPRSTVFSGDREALSTLAEACRAKGIEARSVRGEIAPHGPGTRSMREDLERALAWLEPRPAGVPIYTGTTGGLVRGEALDGDHWARMLSEPSRFADAVQAAAGADLGAFLEIGPHPILLHDLEATLEHAGRRAKVLGSLRRDRGEREALELAREALSAPSPTQPLVDVPHGRSEGERRDRLEARLASLVGEIAGIDPASVDRRRPLGEHGLGSLGGVRLRARIEADLGLTLPLTLIYDHPTLADLSAHILTRLGPGEARIEPAPAPPGIADPIAIVGMACRFPGGGDTPEAFFEALLAGVDAVSAVPEDRWPSPPGSVTDPALRASRWGAFLEGVDLFDPQAFGISPREAERMDPQQRLLLTLCREALERAGIPASRLDGRVAGVFVGLMNDDYRELCSALPDVDLHTTTGNGHAFAAGRLAYTFGFEGPALTVDTACSSALAAIHLACQSLRAGECDLAIVGAASLMLSPRTMEKTARMGGALSPEGRCKSFDARADGFVRGEGGGVVVLEALSRARAEGDPVVALVKGSAVNQDGRSFAFSAPSARAQRAMLRSALARAGIAPAEVGLVEAHGSGTPLGDPIEIEALAEVLGAPRPDGRPLFLGAVKTNLGHLEAASGMAGLIKATLAVQRGLIPGNLHLEQPNPALALAGTRLELPRTSTPWEGSPRIAGVSAFGLSGTNAHVILEQAPALPDVTEQRDGPLILPLSARSPGALSALASATRGALSEPLADLCYTAGARRDHHPHRLAIVAEGRGDLDASLSAFTRGEAAPGLFQGQTGPHRLCLIFPGQGSQRPGMGREMFQAHPVFREAVEACHAEARRQGLGVIDDLLADPGDPARLSRVTVWQPWLLAVEIGLLDLLRSRGVEPDAVLGHSMGEAAAAYAAGAITLQEAMRLVCGRARILEAWEGQGAMASVDLGPDEAREVIGSRPAHVAAFNGPRSTVISGDRRAIEAVVEALQGRGVGARLLASNLPAHTPALIPLAGAWTEDLRWLGRREPALPLYSTVTGARIDALEPPHWARNLHDPVLFQPALERLLDDGFDLFLEVGPHPVLGASIDAIAERAGRRVTTVPTLRRDLGERRSTLEALAALHVHGRSLDWARIQPRGRVVALPTTPWENRRCWLPDPPAPPRPASALHEIRWEPSPLPRTRSDLSGRWILLGEGPLAAALTEAIQARGGEVLTEGDPARSGARAVIYLAPRAEDLPGIEAGCAGLVATVQALSAAPSARLVLVTSGAVHDGAALTQAPLWGLGRVIASEHPELRFSSVDVGSPGDLGALVELLGDPESSRVEQSALRGGERWIPRLSPLPEGTSPGRSPVRRDGTYLITGGLGDVGSRVARWMAEKGAGRLVLMGRSAPRARADEAVSAMERAGARVEIAPADVASEADLARVLASIDASSPPLRGVIHAAGVADSALLAELGADRIGPALSAKIAGALHLDRLTRGRPLDFFVLFSSLATWLGLPGQGTYAAANAFLDALARQRRACGLPALSVGWAAWSGLGFASSPGVERALSHLARVGLRGFTPEEALSTLEALLSAGERAPAQVITLPRGEAAGDVSPRWASLFSEPTAVEIPEGAAPPARASLLAEADPARRLLGLVDHTRATASTVLRIAPSEIGSDTPLGALGMDSFLAVELRRRLQDSLGLVLPATIAFRRPTVMELANHLAAALGEAPEPPDPAPAPRAQAPGLAEALAEIEALGDADVRRILAEP